MKLKSGGNFGIELKTGGNIMLDNLFERVDELNDLELLKAIKSEKDTVRKKFLLEVLTYRGRMKQQEIINMNEFVR